MMFRRSFLTALLCAGLMGGGVVRAQSVPEGDGSGGLRLLMVEQAGCIYCQRWDAEISVAYPLTDEGKAAPLQRIQLRDPIPEGVTLISKPVFTPTFILLRNGVEAGRIEGYPGDNFFWPLLAELLRQAQDMASGN